MKLFYSITLASLAWTAFAQSAPVTHGADELRYEPAIGVETVKRWTAKHTLTMQVFTSQTADEPVITHPLTGKMESSQVLTVTDVPRALAEGRPQILERRFDKIASAATLNLTGVVQAERKASLASDLQGAEVRYTWVPEEETYGKFFHAEEGDESDLAPLGEDMDLRCLLPAEAAGVGSTWEVDAEDLVHLLAPCGEVQLRTAEGSDKRLARSIRFGLGGGLEYAFGGKSQADCSVTWKENRDVGGQSCAVLSVVLDGRFVGEKNEILGEDVLMGEALRGARFDRIEIALRLQGRGEVLWNLDANQAQSMDLALAEDATLRVFEQGPDGRDVVQNLTMRGLLQLDYGVELPAAGPLFEDAGER